MRKRWAVLLFLAACGNTTAQGGATNVPDLNKPWGPEDRGHDVISNGPEACGPSVKRPEGANLPQCPEVAGSTKGRLPTAPAIPLNAKPPAKPIAPAGSAGAPPK
jgi:hypothetical protein